MRPHLFEAGTKYDSGTGVAELHPLRRRGLGELETDRSLFMERTEVLCASCGGYLGHLFDDGPGLDGSVLHQLVRAPVERRADDA